MDSCTHLRGHMLEQEDEKDKKNTEDLFDCGGDSGSFGAPLDGIERALDL